MRLIRKPRSVIALALLAGLVVPVSATARSEWYGQVFKSPTGNLVCKYRSSNDSIACGRWNDEGIVAMASTGPAREGWRMDWRGLQAHTLFYGEYYRGVGSHITCRMAYNGVRCTNWRGHGFFMSRTDLNMW